MTPHNHREYVEGCYRCDLSRDEQGDTMTEWLESEAGRAVVNATLPAVESALFGVMMRRQRGERVSDQAEAILLTKVALSAALSPTSETCGTCGGKAKIISARPSPSRLVDCPDCTDGRVSAAPALVPRDARRDDEQWRAMFAEALQDAWNDYCADTGCHPDEFERKGGRLYATFGQNFTRSAADIFRHRLENNS